MTSALTVTDAEGRPVQTVGRRKEAVVRVRLLPGTGHREGEFRGEDLVRQTPDAVGPEERTHEMG